MFPNKNQCKTYKTTGYSPDHGETVALLKMWTINLPYSKLKI